MKKILVFITTMCITVVMLGQAPASFKYQAVLRDARGNVKANTSTNIIISILSGSATGTIVYSETHSISTDGYGLVNLEIGKGTVTIGTMSAISWNTGSYFVKTTVDGIDMGTSQLLSVPYSIYSSTAGNGLSTADAAKLAGIEGGAEVNVNADWNASGGDAQILNKPVIANADWNASSGPAQILNKPTISVVDGAETKINPGTNITVTGTGTSGNPYVINAITHTLGEEYEGGIVFYVYDGGKHGLIAAKEDLLTGMYGDQPGFLWFISIDGNVKSGAIGDGLEAGKMNTSLIIATQMSYYMQMGNPPIEEEHFAAKVCVSYSTTDADEIIYSNWYLPSKYELNLLFLAMENVPGLNLAQDYYWSSTEVDRDNVWFQNFYDGTQDFGESSKNYGYPHVRPIRSF